MVSERRGAKSWVRLGRLLAFVAALALAIGLHPPHAEAAAAVSDHSHFSAACVKADAERPSHAKSGFGFSGHLDCHQLLHPLLRTEQHGAFAFGAALHPLLRGERARHFVFPFDPPPPRGA